MVNPDDLNALALTAGDRVDVVGVRHDDPERRAEGFEVVPYPTARGSAAYYQETQVLVPLDSVADEQPAHLQGHRRTAGGFGTVAAS